MKRVKRDDDPFDIDLYLIGQTEKAFKVRVDPDAGDPFWLPKSQTDIGELKPDGSVEVTVPLWLAKERGLC